MCLDRDQLSVPKFRNRRNFDSYTFPNYRHTSVSLLQTRAIDKRLELNGRLKRGSSNPEKMRTTRIGPRVSH